MSGFDQDHLLYEELANRIGMLIEKGTYRPGERIPSVREMSRQQGVSISTVIHAYYLLEDRGLVEAKPQSGYYVRTILPSALLEPEISSPEPDPGQVSVQELVMRVLRDANNPSLVQLGAALPNLELLPTENLNRLLNSIGRELGKEGGTYIIPPGVEALRAQIAQRSVRAGCSLAPNDIVITSGCIEAVDLCLKAVCRPGDIVAVESPIYFGLLQTLEVHGLKALEIPTHPRDGISVAALHFAIEHNPIRACLVISNFNNPLGSQIPDENKKELVELLARHDIPLIEDDILGELYFTDRRPIVAKAFDKTGLVMLCSSFSKDLCPGYRIGWVVPGRFESTIQWLKYTASVSAPTLPQYAIAEFLASGGYDHHLRRARKEYARNIARISQAVMKYFPSETRVTRPSGGFVLWVQMPDAVDSLELYSLAIKEGITLTPGYLFSPSKQFRNFIRINAADWSYKIDHALETLGDIIAELARK
ncbi:MAG TPA: PLP-dependent aminotransferase family protein [Anaerolineales bacterium]|nr:PLP-dependent aminotransferase family protein [Anaerolineales bacterium]